MQHLAKNETTESKKEVKESRVIDTGLIEIGKTNNLLRLCFSTTALSDEAFLYLNYFKDIVSEHITVTPAGSSNHLLTTFIPLAAENESIKYALISWGGLFIGRKINLHNYRSYMVKAAKYALKIPSVSLGLTKDLFFTYLSFLLIAMSIEICSGEVFYWHVFLDRAKQLIKERRGIANVLSEFLNTNEIKWLISNLQFHDILNSGSMSKGCEFMDDYKSAFREEKLLEINNYGVDPFQGCIQPIYLLLGDIMNLKASIKEKKVEFEEAYIIGDTQDCRKRLFDVRQTFYRLTLKKITQLKEAVSNCEPHNLSYIFTLSQKERELHCALFELVKISCHLLLRQIENIPPVSYGLQRLLFESFPYIDRLLNSSLVPCIGFSLLMCASVAYTKEEQEAIDEYIQVLLSKYIVGNIRRVYEVIQGIWKEIGDGEKCVDWSELVEKKGWILFCC